MIFDFGDDDVGAMHHKRVFSLSIIDLFVNKKIVENCEKILPETK